MHVKGTDKQADHRINTPGVIQAVRGSSELPVQAWGAASTLPPAPQSAQWMLQRGHRRARPTRILPPKFAVEKTSKSPVGLLEKSTSDENAKITINVKQTSR